MGIFMVMVENNWSAFVYGNGNKYFNYFYSNVTIKFYINIVKKILKKLINGKYGNNFVNRYEIYLW